MEQHYGDRIIFDPISRAYIRASLRFTSGRRPIEGVLRFTTTDDRALGTFLVEPDFQLSYADHDDLLSLFRAVAEV